MIKLNDFEKLREAYKRWDEAIKQKQLWEDRARKLELNVEELQHTIAILKSPDPTPNEHQYAVKIAQKYGVAI